MCPGFKSPSWHTLRPRKQRGFRVSSHILDLVTRGQITYLFVPLDPTFNKYKRDAVLPDPETQLHDEISIAQLWMPYTNYKLPQLAQSIDRYDLESVKIITPNLELYVPATS